MKKMGGKFLLIVFLSVFAAYLGSKVGLSSQQVVAVSVSCMSLLGIVFFWELRLSFVFFGSGLLLITRAVDLKHFLEFASLDVILFLIGMMILVGMLNEAGLVFWSITRILRIKKLTGKKLFLLIMGISTIASGLMGEVASIIIIANIIIEISVFFDIDPIPLLIPAVLATNIGSSGTLLGNPIGVLIAARGSLTFEDFLTQAFPITIGALLITILLLFVLYRKYIRVLDEKVHLLRDNPFFLSLITISPSRKVKVSAGIFILTIIAISLHRRFELFFMLEENTLLLMLPIVAAGIVLLYRHDKVRHYVEREVEWTSILFFLFLFAQAGVIKYSGISDFFANKIIAKIGTDPRLLSGFMLFSSGILSSILDNTVVVASYIPIVQSLGSLDVPMRLLWWSILFGACYGGNITVIGSTANIVAVDILEKKAGKKIDFFRWLKVGLIVGLVSMAAAYIMLLLVFVR